MANQMNIRIFLFLYYVFVESFLCASDADTSASGAPSGGGGGASSIAGAALTGAIMAAAADPTSIDAEKKVPNMDPFSQGSAGGSSLTPPDLDLLWKCKRDSSANKATCVFAIQLFCSGRCTRLNCMVPTNYVTCLDVCGEKATMIQPCLDAGKRNPGPAQIMNVAGAFDPSEPPPPPTDPAAADPNQAGMQPGMQPGMNPMMDPNMMMGMMAASAGMSAASAGVKALSKIKIGRKRK
jgi:hypothetical protein